MKRVTDSRGIKFPLDGKASLPLDVVEAVSLISRNGPDYLKVFRRTQTGMLKMKARQWQQDIERRRGSLTDAQRRIQGELNLPLVSTHARWVRNGENKTGRDRSPTAFR